MEQEILEYIDKNYDRFIEDLKKIVHQPSIAAKKEGVEECADLLLKIMEEIGIKTEILRIPGASPLVYGEIPSKKNPKKTFLFYDHYDVQPAEPFDLWETPPFEPVIRDGKMYGRGPADNKGDIASRLGLVRTWLDVNGDVPCNFKFLFEGEEEIGSPHLKEYFDRYSKKFKCDGVAFAGGEGLDEEERPVIALGVKGILYVELEAKGPKKDIHSAKAAIIDNPAWHLIRALNTLKDKEDKILIPGWYDGIKPFTEEEIKWLETEPLHEKAMKEDYGIKSFMNNIEGLEAKKALAGKPTCTICGLLSGWTGPSSKTILPAKASAKIDFRMVLGQQPEMLVHQLKSFLKSNGYGDIEVTIYGMNEAARTPPTNKLVKAAVKAAEEEYPKPPVVRISLAGSAPMYLFTRTLNAPCILIGVNYAYSNIHSPNENMRIQDFIKGTKWVARTVDHFVKMN